VLVVGCGCPRIADHTCSATTLGRRRDEWITTGVAEQLGRAVLAAYDRLVGLSLDHLAVDSCTTKAPCGGQTAGPGPVDRRKQGLKRSVAVAAAGIPLAAMPAPIQASRRWVIERTHAWGNQGGKLCWCTERRRPWSGSGWR
jgi:hypothetical protein